MTDTAPRRRSCRGAWTCLLTQMAAMFLASSAGAETLVDATRGLDLNHFNTTVGSGARAWGMGGAFVAVADDATAATWNPAGLAILQRPEVTLVYVPVDDNSFDYQGFTFQQSFPLVDGTYTGFASELDSHYIDYASFAYPIVSNTWILVPQLSYQRAINRAFRLTQRTPSFIAKSGGSGPFNQALLERSTQSQQGYDVLAASLAWSPRQEVAIGASINWWNVDVELADDETSSESNSSGQKVSTSHRRIDQEGAALNANLGLMWRPIPRMAVGLVYKTGFDLDLRVDDVTTERSDASYELPKTNTIDQSGSGTIDWPETIALGISGRPIQQLLLSADWTTTNWSKTTYKGDRDGKPVDEPFPGGADAAQADSRQLRLGAEYALIGEKFAVPFRAGIFTDRQILRDDAGETVDIRGYSIGSGLAAGNWFFDLAIVRTKWASFRNPKNTGFDVTPRGNGQIESDGTRIYISGIYRFPLPKKGA